MDIANDIFNVGSQMAGLVLVSLDFDLSQHFATVFNLNIVLANSQLCYVALYDEYQANFHFNFTFSRPLFIAISEYSRR